MMSMNSKQAFSMHPILHEPKYTHLHSSSEAIRRACLPAPQLQSNFFTGLDETLLRGAEALAAVDMVSQKSHPFKPDATYHTMSSVSVSCTPTTPSVHLHHPSVLGGHAHHAHHHQPAQGLDGDLLEHLNSALALPDVGAAPAHPSTHAHLQQALNAMGHPAHGQPPMGMGPHPPHGLAAHPVLAGPETETDPRELESFAERFKQRRIKLGVTQADVGSALANLKIPGVGSLSQSTICRFESLTLSHNNMIALKPILQAWLEEAEGAQRDKLTKPDGYAAGDKKRKRTSIAAPEKRSLEAYFALQPRPSSDKIAAIAEKLDLKKNVVRVWFCNQRQKQKRMKFSAAY
ncbi:LOW QUALITY PROTEIN: brain-specific homeobox/POU domain protein 3-like [Sphaerodactylus townsendi]|uniref:LOW QUALITY PROTEIN: brain-specific homeobox/POU domain protein 3-like n=1 Tax=Sphaerodactylus townsendi TaxID=933632 RepID=UPI00202622D3|nr:LOW QUALITY PROTEIN: brain-specific homeobox/POU domain protein 3-like [Sphaerodactylus townsendi]